MRQRSASYNGMLCKASSLVATVAALAAAPAVLADEERGFTLTPMAGFIHFVDNTNIEETVTGSLALGYKFDSPWALEGAYLGASSEVKGSVRDIDYQQLRLDALYYLGANSNTRPYLLIGAGEQGYDAGEAGEEYEAFLNAGVGLKHRFTDLLSLRSDVRAVQSTEEYRTDWAFNIGLQFFFGKAAKASAPAPVEAPKPLDSDGDGVVDSLDNCPNSPAGKPVNARGCPRKPRDDDKDGVPNNKDKCPDTAPGAKVDATGCYVVIEKDVTVSLNVNFENNSDKIASGREQIKEVADFMKEHPLTEVTVEGHTDSLGSDAYNKQLSQRRAEAVAAVLTSYYELSADRVKAVGYGESRPVASNDTAEGRAKNRRVTAVVKASVEKRVQ